MDYRTKLVKSVNKRLLYHPNGVIVLPRMNCESANLFCSTEKLSKRDKLIRIAAWTIGRRYKYGIRGRGRHTNMWAFLHPQGCITSFTEHGKIFSVVHYSVYEFYYAVPRLEVNLQQWLPIKEFVVKILPTP